MTDDRRSSDPPNAIQSPFASVEATIDYDTAGGRNSRRRWMLVVVAVSLVAGIGVVFTIRHLNDPYRTLEAFPTSRYFEDYHPLAGSTFRAELRVEADLGWKENTGRLMVFTTESDNKSIVVLIAPKLAGTYFMKGQTYLAQLQVREGGLIYASSCRKM